MLFEFFKAHRCELLALGRLRHGLPSFVTGLALRRLQVGRKSSAGSRLLFLAEFLESGIAAQRVPERIEPKKGRRKGKWVNPAP